MRYSFIESVREYAVPLVLVIVIIPCSIAHAEQTCASDNDPHFSAAPKAVENWSKRNNIALPKTTANSLVVEFCIAARSLQSDKPISDGAINQLAPQVLDEYLDREINVTANMRSIASSLRSAAGYSGLSRPVMRKLIHLSVKYVVPVDHIQIDGQAFLPDTPIVALPGKLIIDGMKQDKLVCRAILDPASAEHTAASCEKI